MPAPLLPRAACSPPEPGFLIERRARPAFHNRVVQAFRASSISRALLVATMLTAWFALLNHCAIARATHPTAAPCCHAASDAPVDRAPCEEMPLCCKTVKASLPDQADLRFDAAASEPPAPCAGAPLPPATAPEAAIIHFDHGPPRALSFAETVLHRSLPSLAPPHAV